MVYPSVAEPCRQIRKGLNENVDLSFEYTLRWNYAAVISDGTRALGLGNIGPEAALSVMEGRALLFLVKSMQFLLSFVKKIQKSLST